MASWYVGSVQYTAVTARANSTAYSVGDIRRPVTPGANGERCFRCTTAGTSAAAPPAAFSDGSVAVGGTLVDGTVTWTEVTGNPTYNWAAPYARLETAVSAARSTAGDTFYVAHDHAQTTGSNLTITPAGTPASPHTVLCVNAAGSVPPVSADLRTTAQVITTGAASMTLASGCMYVYGVRFQCSTGGGGQNLIFSPTASNNNLIYTLESCQLNNNSTGAIGHPLLGGTAFLANRSRIRLINSTIGYGAVGQSTPLGPANFEMRGGGLTGSSPTTFLSGSVSSAECVARFDGVDLSPATGALVAAIIGGQQITFANCKFAAAPTIGTPTAQAGSIDVISSGNTGSSNRQERYRYEGTLTRESVIVFQATDGVAAMSWKVVTTANAKTLFPFDCFEIAQFNALVGSPLTATVEIVNDGVTLKNDEIWIEVEHMDTVGQSIGTISSSGRADPLAAGANVPTSTAAWTTTGLASPVKQKMSVTFTPQIAGLVRVLVRVGKASQTVYIDPRVTIT